MPDPAPEKRRYLPAELASLPRAVPPYAELHCKTNFSFLEASSHPDELVTQAAALGYQALAITDRHSLAGIVRAHVAAHDANLKLIIGAEIWPEDALPVVLWAPHRQGYAQLCRLLTLGRRRAPKGDCQLRFSDLAEGGSGLLAGVLLSPFAKNAKQPQAAETLHGYREAFGDRCYALASLYKGPEDALQLQQMQKLARRAQVPLVAAGDVYYHVPRRQALQDVMVAIRNGCTIHEAGERLFVNAQRHLHPPEEIVARFAAARDWVARTMEVASRVTFSLKELRYEYPLELAPVGVEPLDYLRQLTWEGARSRYPQTIPPAVRDLLEHELRLIADLQYEAYFLTVWDLVRFARSRGILCQGRGSAANSAVCFCLGVTSVDPARIDVLFERFISRERNEAPDIDIDFEHERREEVLQYVYDKYGREHAGMTAEVITYGGRLAVREVGKVLGISQDRIDAMSKTFDSRSGKTNLRGCCHDVGLDPDSPLGKRLVWLTEELIDHPRHISQHVGGMVITRTPLVEMVPIENAAMQDRTVVQWDKDDLDSLGILKVDCLGLGMLTALRKGFELIERHAGLSYSLATVPAEDPAVYEMACRADTVGVFQIESRAQMSMLPRLRPRCFYDLVVEVAIVRPGPIQGNMVHPYLRRRCGLESVEYPNDQIRDVLNKTLGVPIFQEQAMRLAIVAAGFTPGDADQLRRAMAAWRRPGLIEQFRQKLIHGMLARGLSAEYAEQVFRQLRGFGEYGFPESHAASFALLVYVSAWMKRYYPAVFCAALLNSQPLGFYAPAQLVRDAREHQVVVLPVDVQNSDWDCTLEPLADQGPAPALALRLGLRMIQGLGQQPGEAIVAARRQAPFHSLHDLARRAGLGRGVLLRLSRADALRGLGTNRRGGVWDSLAARRTSQEDQQRPLLAALDEADDGELLSSRLSPASEFQEVVADFRATGLSLRRHPISFLRPMLDQKDVARSCELPTKPVNRQVRVAGMVLVRQRPGTAKGITFATLEDESGVSNLVIRQPVWEQYRRVARNSVALLAHGKLQRQGQVIHVVVNKLEDLSSALASLQSQSRDFH